MSATLDLTRALIELASMTPDDAGCQRLLADRLEPLGFDVEWIPFGDVTNVVYTHGHEWARMSHHCGSLAIPMWFHPVLWKTGPRRRSGRNQERCSVWSWCCRYEGCGGCHGDCGGRTGA